MTIPSPLDDERLRRLTEQATTMAARAKDAAAELNRIAVTVTSRNRGVTVTVGSGGILRGVRPGPGAARLDAAHLCSAMMEAYGTAARQAANEASELMASVTGRDTRVMQMMRESMPPEAEEESS